MNEGAMVPGPAQPVSSALKYMTVPEKIELTSDGMRGGYPSARTDQANYRPMKVPDMITLESTSPTETSTPMEPVIDLSKSRWGTNNSEPISQGQPPEPPRSVQEPLPVPIPKVDQLSALPDLERRVKTLEQQVQKLKDIAIYRGGGPSEPRQGNSFWYVVTFAGWMMIPLIVAYMYRYRRY